MIIINGRFLTQNVTGVQRFALEIVRELDNRIKPGLIKIIAPKDARNIVLNNISMEKRGRMRGHLWEQAELPFFMERGDMLLNLCNTAPAIKTGIVSIHDISTRVNPEYYNWKFRIWYNILNAVITKTSEKIITVSEFSKSEIIKYYKINEEKIKVVYNSWQHMGKIMPDDSVLEKLDISPKEYYLAVSSVNPNKNFRLILRAAEKLKDKQFVIAGKFNQKIFGDLNIDFNKMPNVKYAGYVSDNELKSLYTNAKAFIFPSFYEGFGIPPLEAAACGTNVIISNKSSIPEIFGDGMKYFDPDSVEELIKAIIEDKEINQNHIENMLEKYSWDESAEKIKRICMI